MKLLVNFSAVQEEIIEQSQCRSITDKMSAVLARIPI